MHKRLGARWPDNLPPLTRRAAGRAAVVRLLRTIWAPRKAVQVGAMAAIIVCVRSEEASEGQTCGGLRDFRRRVRIELRLQNAGWMASASFCRPADCSGLTAQSAPSSLLFRGSCLLIQLPTTGCGPLCDAQSKDDGATAANERAGARRVLQGWCKGQKGGGSGGRPCRQQPFQS